MFVSEVDGEKYTDVRQKYRFEKIEYKEAEDVKNKEEIKDA